MEICPKVICIWLLFQCSPQDTVGYCMLDLPGKEILFGLCAAPVLLAPLKWLHYMVWSCIVISLVNKII